MSKFKRWRHNAKEVRLLAHFLQTVFVWHLTCVFFSVCAYFCYWRHFRKPNPTTSLIENATEPQTFLPSTENQLLMHPSTIHHRSIDHLIHEKNTEDIQGFTIPSHTTICQTLNLNHLQIATTEEGRIQRRDNLLIPTVIETGAMRKDQKEEWPEYNLVGFP